MRAVRKNRQNAKLRSASTNTADLHDGKACC